MTMLLLIPPSSATSALPNGTNITDSWRGYAETDPPGSKSSPQFKELLSGIMVVLFAIVVGLGFLYIEKRYKRHCTREIEEVNHQSRDEMMDTRGQESGVIVAMNDMSDHTVRPGAPPDPSNYHTATSTHTEAPVNRAGGFPRARLSFSTSVESRPGPFRPRDALRYGQIDGVIEESDPSSANIPRHRSTAQDHTTPFPAQSRKMNYYQNRNRATGAPTRSENPQGADFPTVPNIPIIIHPTASPDHDGPIDLPAPPNHDPAQPRTTFGLSQPDGPLEWPTAPTYSPRHSEDITDFNDASSTTRLIPGAGNQDGAAESPDPSLHPDTPEVNALPSVLTAQELVGSGMPEVEAEDVVDGHFVVGSVGSLASGGEDDA